MTLDKMGIDFNANFDKSTAEIIFHMMREREAVTITFTKLGGIRDITINKPYRVYLDEDGDAVISDDSGDRMMLNTYLKSKIPGYFNVTTKAVAEWKEKIKTEKKQLLERFAQVYFTQHSFKPGDRVKWRDDMQLGTFMDDGVDAIVAEVLSEPVRLPITSVSEMTSNVRNETFDIKVMVVSDTPRGLMTNFVLLPSYRIQLVDEE